MQSKSKHYNIMLHYRYKATFTANNGSTYCRSPYEYFTLKQAIADIRAIVKGNHFRQSNNRSTYEVRDLDGKIVAQGEYVGLGRWIKMI